MRTSRLATTLITSGLLITAGAQLVPFLNPPHPDAIVSAFNSLERPSAAPPVAPVGSNNDEKQRPMAASSYDEPAQRQDAAVLSDVISSQNRIKVFAGLTRDISSVSGRLENASLNTTVLAPTNAALQALPRKPWEDPAEYDEYGAKAAYVGIEGEKRAYENMKRFTEAHIIPVSPWKEGEKVTRMGGGDNDQIWWETDEHGTMRIMPGKTEVEAVASRVGNGEVWILKDVLNYRF